MSQLSRGIRKTVKQGNLIPAIVLDTQGNRATVRLSGNGAIYHNLLVTGGPIFQDDQVHVDFTTGEPTIVASSNFSSDAALRWLYGLIYPGDGTGPQDEEPGPPDPNDPPDPPDPNPPPDPDPNPDPELFKVVGTYPSNHQTGIDTSVMLLVLFNIWVDPLTFDNTTVYVKDPNNTTVNTDARLQYGAPDIIEIRLTGGTTYTANTKYTVTVKSSIQADTIYHTNLEADYVFDFTTDSGVGHPEPPGTDPNDPPDPPGPDYPPSVPPEPPDDGDLGAGAHIYVMENWGTIVSTHLNTNSGIEDALDSAEAGTDRWVWFPTAYCPGDHTVRYNGVHCIGRGRGRTVLTGQWYINDGGSMWYLSVSPHGTWTDAYAGVVMRGDGYFDYTAFHPHNTNAGSEADLIGLANVANSAVLGENCRWAAVNDGVGLAVGIWGNAQGGYENTYMAAAFATEYGITPQWFIYTDGYGLLRFYGVDWAGAPSGWCIDGFVLKMWCKRFIEPNSTIHLKYEATDWGERNYTQDYELHDQSYFHHYSLDPATYGNASEVPPIPSADSGVAENVHGIHADPDFWPRDTIEFVWYHQQFGLGSDYSGGWHGEQVEHTADAPGEDEFVYYRLKREMGGSSSMINRHGNAIALYCTEIFVFTPQGHKIWLAPYLFNIHLHTSEFYPVHDYDIIVENHSMAVVDQPTFATIRNYLGPVIVDGSQEPTWGDVPPANAYPGQQWFDTYGGI